MGISKWFAGISGKGKSGACRSDPKPQEQAAPKRTRELADNLPQRGMAVMGQSHGPARECATPCISCGKMVVVLMPGAAVPGQVAQMVMKHQCTHCGKALFALTHAEKVLLCTDCRMVSGQFHMADLVELEVLTDATFPGGGSARLEASPLVLGRDSNGDRALLSPEEEIHDV